MFDDQTGMVGPARAVIYSYDLTAGTATVVWQYLGTTTSQRMGSFRILSDGSRVIGWGACQNIGRGFSEVDEDGNVLLNFGFLDGSRTYRAIKIPTSALDINLLRATAGSTDERLPSLAPSRPSP